MKEKWKLEREWENERIMEEEDRKRRELEWKFNWLSDEEKWWHFKKIKTERMQTILKEMDWQMDQLMWEGAKRGED